MPKRNETERCTVEMDQTPKAWDAWEPIFAYWIRAGEGSTKTNLGSRSPRVCRFCGRGKSTTTFRQLAHVIPAAFGNRSLFSFEECDDCNLKLGSPLEDDLAKFLSLPRAISRLPGRKGTPKIRHPHQAAYVQSNRDKNLVYTYLPTEDQSVQVEDDGKGTLRLTIVTPTHRPTNVAKALGRMLLFGLDPQEAGFDRLRSWVRGEVDWYPIPLVILHFPGAGYNKAGLMADRYTQSPGRSVIRVGFMYSSFLTTMPIPMDDWSLPSGLKLLHYPSPFLQPLLSNTSVFLIKDEGVEQGGTAEALITYRDRREVDRNGR
jgi:hypothetical protein